MNRLLALILFAGTLAAQQPGTVYAPKTETRLYEPKNLSGSRTAEVCLFVSRLIAPEFAGASVLGSSEMKACIIQGTPEAIAKAEEYLKHFDIPAPVAPRAPAASFTIYLVRASAAPPDHPRPLPSELDSVIAEMKRSFVYDSYSLYDTILMAPETGEIESMIPGAQFNGTPYFYLMRRAGGTTVDVQTKTITVPNFTFTLRVPYQSGNEIKLGTSSINSGIHIQEGQKLVLGKVKVDPQNNTDAFLVITVKLQ
jgi:hypothetical protein